MKPTAKRHLRSALYCALLAGLNWFNSIEYARKIGVTHEGFYPVEWAFLVSGGVAVYFVFRCIKAARICLEHGEAVKKGKWIQDWAVLIYAIPLLFGRQSTSNWYEPDGALATTTRGYGHALSGSILVFAVVGMLAFQIHQRLSGGRGEPKCDPETPNP